MLAVPTTASAEDDEERLAFKGCQELFEAKNSRAAACFVGVADKWPRSEHADSALFNAAVAAEMAGDIPAALTACQRVVSQYPKSRHTPRALALWARHEERRGNLEAATRLRMQFVHRYPQHDEAADALVSAAAWLALAEDWKRLDQVTAQYTKYFGRTTEARYIASMSVVFPGISDCGRVRDHAPRWLGRWKERDALTDRVELLLAQCLEPKEPKNATRLYERIAARGGEGSVEAAFRLVDRDRGAPAKLRLRETRPKHLRKELEARLAAVRELSNRYDAVVSARGPGAELRWRQAAVVRKAEIIENLARDLRAVPVPPDIHRDPDARAIYLQALEDQATTMEARAIEHYLVVVKRAAELGYYDEFVAWARARLSKLRPKEWPVVAGKATLELGPAPPEAGTAKENGDPWDVERRRIAWKAISDGDLPLAVYNLQGPGDDVELLHLAAVVASRRGEWGRALALLTRATTLAPSHPVASGNLVLLRAGLGLK